MNDEQAAFRRAFGRVVRDLRHDAGMSQAQLAKRISRTQQTVAHYETGRHVPRDWSEVARAFGLSAAELFARVEGLFHK